jgi:hypothetical protein
MRSITRGKKPNPFGATHLSCMKYVHVWQQSRKPAGSWFGGHVYSQGMRPGMRDGPV